MLLIIGINEQGGYYSINAERGEIDPTVPACLNKVDPTNVTSVIGRARMNMQFPLQDHELILVVENNQVIHSYQPEDWDSLPAFDHYP